MLCRFGGPLLDAWPTARERRRALLDAVVGAQEGAPAGAGSFLPVFDADEPLASVHAEMGALRARHPALVGERWLVDAGERGLIGPARAPR